MAMYSSILGGVEQSRDISQLLHRLRQALIVCNLGMQQADLACSILDASGVFFASFGLFYDILGRFLRAFDVVLQLACLCYPAIDVWRGFC
jgi:hypothetical protein